MSPLTSPLMTALDARISPLMRPLSLRVSTASGPDAQIEPSIAPSRCRPPSNCTSPLITVPSAINVVFAATDLPLRFFSLPNIGSLLDLDRGFPGELLLDPRPVAVEADAHAVGFEPGRQHDGTADPLEILECVLDAVGIGPLLQGIPIEHLELAVGDALDRKAQPAAHFRVALEVLRDRRDEVPRIRSRDRGQVEPGHAESLPLAAADQATVEREIRAQALDCLVARAHGRLQLVDGRLRDLFGALQHRDAALGGLQV